jgi:hypothetical protein
MQPVPQAPSRTAEHNHLIGQLVQELDFHSPLPDGFWCENMLLLRLVAGFPALVLFDA